MLDLKRRSFITLLGGAAVTWPLAARGQQPTMPIIGFVTARSAEASVAHAAAFRKGLSETGYVEGQNVAVEYHWLDGQFSRLPSVMADLVRRRVAVIATPNNAAALAAKAATTMIPIVFAVGEDPVKLGLGVSLARPGGNATGINFFNGEIVAKRLGLLHDLLPKAARVAVLVNPANTTVAEATLREMPEAARGLGLQIQVINASTGDEIDAAFATVARERADALFVGADGFFISRAVQLATLATRHAIPATYGGRDFVALATVAAPAGPGAARKPIGVVFRSRWSGLCRVAVAHGELIDAATAPGLSYVHIWRNGDVVMWDNRATMHRGRPWPAHEARLMVRTTISATEADGLETVRLPPRQAAE